MANVHTTDRHEIPGPDIRVLNRRAEERRAPDANPFRMAGHRPELGQTLGDSWAESFTGAISATS